MASHHGLLKNLYLFKSLDGVELDALSQLCEVLHLAAGDTVFLKGEPAKALYLLKHGYIKIQATSHSGDTIEIATLGEGSHFGEMPFVDGEKRSATATAAERSEIIAIPYDKLHQYLDHNAPSAAKFYRELSRFLAGRLRITTSDLTYAREKNLSHF